MATTVLYSKDDLMRIITEKQRRLEELKIPSVWDRYTRHMESGEYRAFCASCRDDEICIVALKYLSEKEL